MTHCQARHVAKIHTLDPYTCKYLVRHSQKRYGFSFTVRKEVKAKAVGIVVIMCLSFGEQGCIWEQMTSCEEIGKWRGERRRQREKKGVRTHC